MNLPHPFNENFSTTRWLTKEKPAIKTNTEDKFETVLFLPEGESRQGEGGLRTQGCFKTSLPNKPLITVITVIFNGEKFLEETIQSVINQTYDNVEYIIIDGGSTDGTLDIIRQYEHAIDYWISEKDSGMYDALAKGLQLATGHVLAYINAGDYYHKCCFEIVYECFSKSDVNWLTGYSVLYNEKSQIYDYWLPGSYRRNLITAGAYGRLLPHIQQESTFWSAPLNRKIDLMALSKYKLAGDHFIWSQFALYEELQIVRAYLGGFKVHEGQLSSSSNNYNAEVDLHRKKMAPLDFIYVLIDKIVMLLNDGIKCRLNKRIITFDYYEKKWK